MSNDIKGERTTANQRIAFDDKTCEKPKLSQHWKSLVHEESDKCIHTLEELKDRFRSDVLANKANSSNDGELMVTWSCVSGYCEALATHKEASRRFQIFPIPIDAIERLVKTEFWSKVLLPAAEAAKINISLIDNSKNSLLQTHQARHRSQVQAVANAVWDSSVNSQKKDEEHANSLYVCLRGHIDRKSIDCLGSSVATVAGVKLLQQQSNDDNTEDQSSSNNKNNNTDVLTTSMLTLSEDHVYERHIIRVSPGGAEESTSEEPTVLEGTCEVAIPGSTKRQKAKRACEIAETFREKKACVLLTPESSWLYMAKNPVVCSDGPTSLVPIIANINCNIRSKPPGKGGNPENSSLESKQLFRLKRELLWILYDAGAMKVFPFGILEVGDCEAMVGSERGEEWVVSKSPLVDHGEPILKNEELFLEAIKICRDKYNDAQVYPYYYAGHYHKDAGGTDTVESDVGETNANTNPNNITNTNEIYNDNEHRFVDALRMYSEAARVTSKYRFDTGDCLQLNKHLTALAAFIYEDILTTTQPEDQHCSTKLPPRKSRSWIHASNAKACCFWLFRFLDHLLHWEESSSAASSNAGLTSKNLRFVEILQLSHKHFVGKLLQTFDAGVRNSSLDDFFAQKEHRFVKRENDGSSSVAAPMSAKGSFPVSKRLGSPATLLAKSLRSPKVQIRDIDLVILDDDDNSGGRRGRSSKRRKRS